MPDSASEMAAAGVLVRLEFLTKQLSDIAQQLVELPKTLEETYLRKETYKVELRAADERAKRADEKLNEVRADLDAIVEQQRQNRRLALSGIVLPILATIIAALILAAVLPL